MKLVAYCTTVRIVFLIILGICFSKTSINSSLMRISPFGIWTTLFILLIIITLLSFTNRKNKFIISNGALTGKNVLTGLWFSMLPGRKISEIISIEEMKDKKILFLLILGKASLKNQIMLHDIEPTNKTTNILKITFKAGLIGKASGANLIEYISVDDTNGFIEALRMARQEPPNIQKDNMPQDYMRRDNILQDNNENKMY